MKYPPPPAQAWFLNVQDQLLNLTIEPRPGRPVKPVPRLETRPNELISVAAVLGIYADDHGFSRQNLAEQTWLSDACVAAALRDLINLGLLRRTPAADSFELLIVPGRRRLEP